MSLVAKLRLQNTRHVNFRRQSNSHSNHGWYILLWEEGDLVGMTKNNAVTKRWMIGLP